MGIAAIKIEGRQRSPAYVAQVTKVWRAAIDAVKTRAGQLRRQPGLDGRTEQGRRKGSSNTLGAYHRPWK